MSLTMFLSPADLADSEPGPSAEKTVKHRDLASIVVGKHFTVLLMWFSGKSPLGC